MLVGNLVWAQSLPYPTGPYEVGRLRLHLTDATRLEVLSSDSTAHRELNVEVWYPAQIQSGSRADYLPDLATIQAQLPHQEFIDEFDSAANLVTSGQIETHSIESAKIAAAPHRFPVVLFSHGLGVPPEGYTSQTEELASHGYVVLGVEHTYDSFVSVFPNGKVLDYEDSTWDSKKGEAHAAYTKARVEVWTADLLFVMSKLRSMNAEKGQFALAGHLDLSRLAVVGHSMGGLAAMNACQQDARIAACVDEDSLIYGTPFTHPERQMHQPYLIFLTSSNFAPARTDAQLARVGVDRATFESNVRRNQDELKASLRAHGGVPRLAVLRDPAVEHMGFSDFRVLQASDTREAEERRLALQGIRNVVVAFLDSTLLNKRYEFEALTAGGSPVTLLDVH